MNEKEIISSLSSLVKDPNIEKLSLELNSPNFFSILNITDREIRHSNFLAWLLSPKESHNLSTIFLKWFLKEIFSDERIIWANEFSIESMDLHNVEVFREWQNIDILIKHPKFVIAIENKINSKEHSSQLERYFRKVNDSYPDIEKAFIFLTIDGIEPESDQDTLNYISIDYGLVRTITEIILSVYKDSLSNRVKYYIEDYLLVLNRYIMKEHESVKLAQELYKNHRVAIDFIIENKPDRLSEIREIIESTIAREGYVLETCNKYYARFLTRKLT